MAGGVTTTNGERVWLRAVRDHLSGMVLAAGSWVQVPLRSPLVREVVSVRRYPALEALGQGWGQTPGAPARLASWSKQRGAGVSVGSAFSLAVVLCVLARAHVFWWMCVGLCAGARMGEWPDRTFVLGLTRPSCTVSLQWLAPTSGPKSELLPCRTNS